MKITDKASKEICRKFKYDKENRYFELMNEKYEILAEVSTNIELDDEYSPENFVVKVLHNNRKECTEESIYQVYVGQERIGWIFPVQAIHSNDHSYSNDRFFLKYAYVAWSQILNECEIEVESLESFDILEKYQDDINFLVLDKENCSRIQNFDYNNYIVNLFQNGYSETGLGNIFFSTINNTGKKLKLYRQSSDLDDISYIVELFKKQIPNETSEISRFYTYYQIIELLISKVFDVLFNKFLASINEDSNDLFEQKEKLNEFTNEKYRVRRLCNDYSKIDSQLRNELNDKCVDLLKYTNDKLDKEVILKKGMHDNLYQVRCLIVHRMYRAKTILKEIDDLFLELIIQLVISFRAKEIEK